MYFKPNPLLYGANENFLSSIKIVVEMCSPIDHKTLSRAVDTAMTRFPYFCVCPEKIGNKILLRRNPLPVPVFDDGRCVTLGTEESNGHLLAFGCEGHSIILNVSHYIADGMGIDPLLKTALYLYVSDTYGDRELDPKGLDMPGDPVMKEEYEYPFSDVPSASDGWWKPKELPGEAYAIDPEWFDEGGLYAYHLRVPQKAMMAKANTSDGSPISFISVLLYRALCSLDSGISQPVVMHMQHQYRYALKAPLSRHCLLSNIPAALPPMARDWQIELQNTSIRGQIILGSEVDADLYAINRLLAVFPDDESVSLAEKQTAMRKYIENSVRGKTFGISYIGKMNWYGIDRYVNDMHVFIGEKNARNMLLVEIKVMGPDFSIDLMQGGRGDRCVSAFMNQLRGLDIPVILVGEGRFSMCDTRLPE